MVFEGNHVVFHRQQVLLAGRVCCNSTASYCMGQLIACGLVHDEDVCMLQEHLVVYSNIDCTVNDDTDNRYNMQL